MNDAIIKKWAKDVEFGYESKTIRAYEKDGKFYYRCPWTNKEKPWEWDIRTDIDYKCDRIIRKTN